LVQLTRSFQDENREDYTVSYIIDSSSGKGEFIPEEIPHVMSTSNQYFATRDIHGSYFPSAKMLLINNRE
jgi:hypothetical protein